MGVKRRNIIFNSEDTQFSGQSTLYIFLDESGAVDFTSSKSQFFVMSSVTTLNPIHSASQMLRLRYELLSHEHIIDDFHATNEHPIIRNHVLSQIDKIEGIKCHVIYGDKSKVYSHLRDPQWLYTKFAIASLKFALKAHDAQNFSRVIIIFDKLFTGKKSDNISSELIRVSKIHHKNCKIYFNPVKSEFNAQIADYIGWSKLRQIEFHEKECWELLQDNLKPTEFDYFRNN
jgi:hypothetical protein